MSPKESLSSKILRNFFSSRLWVQKYTLPIDSSSSEKIYLTFDDGPKDSIDNGCTEKILDLLEEYDIKATFFVLGNRLEQNPKIAERISIEGHRIGNHTHTHQDILKLSRLDIVSEIEKCQSIIETYLPKQQLLFRPPKGHLSFNTLKILQEKKAKLVLWSIDSKDSHGKSANAIIKTLEHTDIKGNILLFHDDQQTAHQALRILIPKWVDKGYQFSTI